MICAEETNGNVTVYIYDAAGSPIGMQYHGADYAANAWDVYWYEKNLQGDIVAVYNQAGTKLVSYTYDAWGNFNVTEHSTSLSAAVVNNPFRYRGYYYDIDLGFYYLQTRYYDPVIGRFINIDSALYHSMLGYNLYAYCYNNPVKYYDATGEFADTLMKNWIGSMGLIASVEPTVFGEIVLVVGSVFIIGIRLTELVFSGIQNSNNDIDEVYTPPQNIVQDTDSIETNSSVNEIKEKEEVDPYRRPGQKKQRGELKNKSRRNDDFVDRSNKRHGRSTPKKHTPGRDHKKHFSLDKPIKVFGG